MSDLFGKVGLILACVLFLRGCVGGRPVPLDLAGARASADVSDLSAVLAEAVDERGRLVLAAIARVRDRLDAQLRKMALAGPTATPKLYPTDESRWAYWHNARAAWSMKLADNVLNCAWLGARMVAHRRLFPLDGRKMSLEKIDSILLAEARRSGDFHLAACAPGVWVNYAPLPAKSFAAKDFKHRLAETISRLVLDERRFVVDVDKRRVRIPPLLWACRDMVVSEYHRRYGPCDVTLTTALGQHLNRPARRRLDDALGYAAVRQWPRGGELAVPGREIFFPGKVGRVELSDPVR